MKKLLWGIATFLLVAWLGFAGYWIVSSHEQEKCEAIDIVITDTVGNHFVSEADIVREIDSLSLRCKGMLMSEINTDSIEHMLNAIDKIESASCVALNNGHIVITVKPMKPVLRVFNNDGSYYINRSGKRISADARYYLDVPVACGNFDSTFTPQHLLPLVDYIYTDSVWSSLVSMIKVNTATNIILVPMIRGHVINFGDVENIENKFLRLRHIYRNILPVKGWNYYDTLSVKWAGQVVATKRKKGLAAPVVKIIDESEFEAATPEAMLTGTEDAPIDTITFKTPQPKVDTTKVKTQENKDTTKQKNI